MPRLWTPIFVFILIVTFCCFICGQGLNSGTTVFLSTMGYGTSLAGVLALVFSAAAAISRLCIGPVIDNGRCSAVVMIGIIVLIAGAFIPVVLSGVPCYTVGRILQGAGFGAATTALSTAAQNVLPKERLGEGIGYHGLGQALSMSVGPAIALYLVGTDPASNLYVGISLVAFVALLLSFKTRYEHQPEKLPETSAFRVQWQLEKQKGQQHKQQTGMREAFNIFEPRALPGALPMTILCPAFGFGIFFIGMYGTQLGFAHAGLFYSVSAISMIGVRLFSKSYMDKVLPIKTYTVAIICGLIGYAMLFLSAELGQGLFLASGLFYGASLGISLPLNQSVAVKNTPPKRWGATNALFLLCNDLGIGLSSMIWGFVNDAFSFQASLVAIMVLMVLSYALAWLVYPESAKRSTNS